MSGSIFPSWPGVMSLLLMAVLLAPSPALADEKERDTAPERARARATEALNAARERAGEVRVIRHEDTHRRAYAYEVDGEERVSVAAPQRVDRRPMRVQRSSQRLEEAERATARRISNHYDRHADATDVHAWQETLAHDNATVVPASHRSALAARERAVAATHAASRRARLDFDRDHDRHGDHRWHGDRREHHRNVELEHRKRHERFYAGYDHHRRSRLTGSIHFHDRPTIIHRHHRHHSHWWHDVPVSVRHHYHFSSKHRHHFGTSIGFHLGSRHGVCAPSRFHHRHHWHHGHRFHHRPRIHSGLSIHLEF